MICPGTNTYWKRVKIRTISFMFFIIFAIFLRGLLLKVYKSYIQSKLVYGLTIWGCTTDTNLGKIQWIQSVAARIITGNFDYIHSRGVDIVRPLHLQTVKERWDYFLCVLMFKCIHGLAPNYLCNDVIMYIYMYMYITTDVKESTFLDSFKQNYKYSKGCIK